MNSQIKKQNSEVDTQATTSKAAKVSAKASGGSMRLLSSSSRWMLAASFVLTATLDAQAARYLVMVKNKSQLQALKTQMAPQNGLVHQVALSGTAAQFSRLSKNGSELVKVLPALNSVVIDTDDEITLRKLEASGAIAAVVKEKFIPTPRPVSGWYRQMPSRTENTLAEGSILPQFMLKRPWGINSVKAPQTWSVTKMGLGARVLILDTGIDRDHPAIKPNFEKGKNFMPTGPATYDYADEVGHGTHVAGTTAGAMLGAFSGVAPNAKILAGRVCDTSSCSNVAVAEGINWGITEKVDVINMSLGGIFGSRAEYLAVLAAEQAGVTIVAASGNDGQEYVSYPAAFETSIAVGAIDPKNKKADFSNWGAELDIVAPGVEVESSVPTGSGRESSVVVQVGETSKRVNSVAMAGAAESLTGVSSDLVDCKLGKTGECPAEVRGQIALISRGEIPFVDKVKTAEAAGAIGVILYNNADGLIAGTLQDHKVAFPVVMIEQAVGLELAKAIEAKEKAAGEVKTVPSDYAQFAGTSMATPHVTGVVALMKAANPKLTPAQVREIIKQTAEALPDNTENKLGAGLIDAEKAVSQSLSLIQSELDLPLP